MTIRKLAAISLLLLTSFAASGVSPSKPQLESMYDKAFHAFDTANYDEALKALDEIDKRQPDLAESFNLRGVVYMRQGKYEKAEVALHKALSIEPKFWNASFNLAEIPFLKKDWTEARNRFEALVAGENEGIAPETSQLIQYKILLTFVLQGKENTVDWILNKFELAKDSPALYYSNAAIAFQHGNEKEAGEWLAAAAKHFSAPLNKLYAESIYEVGWMKKPPGESRAAIEITSTAERAENLKTESKANFEKAERAFEQRDFDEAIRLLDLAEAGSPNDPKADNLRGEILMEQKKYDEAETVLQKAFTADPKLREAQYNLAQIPFKKGDYEKARARFEELFSETPGDEKNQAAQLIKFKIYMTLLLEGKDKEAQQMMDQFKFTGDTPALYYAHAAWEFQNHHPDQGIDWVNSARKIYSPALNVVFADSFYDLGWLKNSQASEPPPTDALAQADASPNAEPTPAMRLGQAENLRPLEETAATPAKEKSPVAVAGKATSPAPVVAVAKPSVTPSKAPLLAAKAAATAAASPAVSAGAASKPVASQAFESGSQGRTLFVGTLLVGGVLLLTWLVVQQVRRHASPVALYRPSEPLTEPPFAGEESSTPSDRRADLGAAGPPKLSLNLKASEAAVRAAVLPTGAVTARGAISGVSESKAAPNEIEKPAPIEPEQVAKVEKPEGTEKFQGPTWPTIPPAQFKPAPPTIAPVPVLAAAAPHEETAKPSVAETISTRDKAEISLPVVAEEPPPAPSEKAAAPIEESPAPSEVAPALAEVAAAPTAEKPLVQEKIEAEKETEFEKKEPEEPIVEIPPVAPLPVFAEHAATAEKAEEPIWVDEEPVAQGEPIPVLTTAFSAEPVISELTQPEPESPLELIEPEAAVALPIAGHRPVQSSIESPSFASKIITTEPIRLQPNTPVIMPETTITPASVPATRPSAPTMSVQQPVGGMHTSVQLTFSLEIASMQLTPTFKMSGLQLKPTSKVVSMRLAPSQDPQPPMNLQVTFEVAKIDLANGAIGSVRLSPSAQQKPAVLNSPSFAISGLELMAGQGAAPVQLTPSHQEQASVQLTAEFQIAAIEFTPLFEIATIVLNASSRKVSMQLPGSGPSSIDSAPVFEIENVQLGAGNELGLIEVTPGRSA
ncbi:MAG TPA: tetratricopeptide repeat protein [Chthoniobacterales bacterium]